MTAGPGLGRMVTDWFQTEAVSDGSERVVAASLARIATVDQDRYLTQRLFGNRIGRSRGLRLTLLAALLIALVAGALAVGGVRTPSAGRGNFVTGPSLVVGRGDHVAALLTDGSVIVLGGLGNGGVLLDSIEVWKPGEPSFVAAAPLIAGRVFQTATLLSDGRVLVVGEPWDGEATAEVWNPATRRSIATGAPIVERYGHTATLLGDGRVLIAGGNGADVDPVTGESTRSGLRELELWDPATGSFVAAGSLVAGRPDVGSRASHTATILADGRVLIAGGDACDRASAEIWDPSPMRSESTGPLTMARARHTATLLPDGRVLIVGGFDEGSAIGTAELFDARTEVFTEAGSLLHPRGWHTATLLTDGRVLVVGGERNPPGRASVSIAEPEIWDPATSAFTPAESLLETRFMHTATRLRDGRVLIVGHADRFNSLKITEIWDPVASRMERPATTMPLASPGASFAGGSVGYPVPNQTGTSEACSG